MPTCTEDHASVPRSADTTLLDNPKPNWPRKYEVSEILLFRDRAVVSKQNLHMLQELTNNNTYPKFDVLYGYPNIDAATSRMLKVLQNCFSLSIIEPEFSDAFLVSIDLEGKQEAGIREIGKSNIHYLDA